MMAFLFTAWIASHAPKPDLTNVVGPSVVVKVDPITWQWQRGVILDKRHCIQVAISYPGEQPYQWYDQHCVMLP